MEYNFGNLKLIRIRPEHRATPVPENPFLSLLNHLHCCHTGVLQDHHQQQQKPAIAKLLEKHVCCLLPMFLPLILFSSQQLSFFPLCSETLARSLMTFTWPSSPTAFQFPWRHLLSHHLLPSLLHLLSYYVSSFSFAWPVSIRVRC